MDTTGTEGQAGMFNITPVLAEGGGYGVLYPKGGVVPKTSNVNFSLNSVDPNTALTKIGIDSNNDGFGEICFKNSNHVPMEVVIDQQVVMDLLFISEDADRLIDTRKADTVVISPFNKFTSVNGQEHLQVGKIASGEAVCFDTNGAPGTAGFFNITPVDIEKAGFGVLYPQGDPAPLISSVNFATPGVVNPNTALLEVGMDTNGNGLGEICFKNSEHGDMEVVVDEQALFELGFLSTVAQRITDTRKTPVKIGPGEEVCPNTTGVEGDVGFFNVTPVLAEAGGYGVIYPKGSIVPDTANVNYGLGTVDPNTAMTPVGKDTNGDGFGEICFRSSNHTSLEVVIDQEVLIVADANTFRAPGVNGAVRIGDTRGENGQNGEELQPKDTNGDYPILPAQFEYSCSVEPVTYSDGSRGYRRLHTVVLQESVLDYPGNVNPKANVYYGFLGYNLLPDISRSDFVDGKVSVVTPEYFTGTEVDFVERAYGPLDNISFTVGEYNNPSSVGSASYRPGEGTPEQQAAYSCY